MKGESLIALKKVLHKDLILVSTPSCFLFIVIDSITREVLSSLSLKSKKEIINLGFDNVSVYVLNDKFTTIPSALFNENKAKEYLAFTTSLSESTSVFYDKIDLEKLVVIWSLESELKKDIVEIFSGAVFKNVLTPFIKTTNSYAFENQISSLFFEDRIIISVIRKGKVELVNTFEVKSIEDALYYHLLLFQSTELKQEEIEVVTGGVYKKMDLFLEKLSDYFSNINRVISSDNNNKNQSFVEIVKSIN